jgi:membrane-associated phospholipid phosphatase
VLGYFFPARAQAFAAQAEQAMRSRLVAGVEYPSDVAAGREIGRKAAALAIARGKADGSDAKWTGSVPQGPGSWRGENPIAPLAGTWRPWVLVRADELRPAPPPPFDSDNVKADLAELKSFNRTPRTNHRAIYWEVFGGARAYALWNEVARLKLMESGYDSATSARVLAALNVAFIDAAIACWDAKFAYWYIRPSQLDPELKSLFPPPNHPSYPAAHGCLSTSAATVLAGLFPADRERLLARGKEAAEARVWAGIHYRFDIDAGQELGRKVAEKVLERSFVAAKQ